MHRLLIGGALSLALTSCYNAAEPYRALVANNVTTTGAVSDVRCDNHGAVYYAFRAGAKQYRARATGDLPACATAKVGDPVLVYYAPSDPAINTLLAPSQAYERERGWHVGDGMAIALGCAFVIVFSLVTALRPRRPSRKPGA